MVMHECGDIECFAIPEKNGTFRAQVRVAGHRIQPRQTQTYSHDSSESFPEKNLALHYAMDHANVKFPPEYSKR